MCIDGVKAYPNYGCNLLKFMINKFDDDITPAKDRCWRIYWTVPKLSRCFLKALSHWRFRAYLQRSVNAIAACSPSIRNEVVNCTRAIGGVRSQHKNPSENKIAGVLDSNPIAQRASHACQSPVC